FLNALAEVTRFGDREFYTDWWNSYSVRSYWTTWNKPVFHFMKRHIYSPLVGRGVPPQVAQILVFVFSGVLHELLVGVPTHNILGVAFLGMLLQLPLIILTDPLTRYRDAAGHVPVNAKVVGNLVFWVSFCLVGQPLAALLYFFAWQAKYGSLKPPCVRLSQAALRFAAKPDIAKDVIDALDEVHRVLNAVTSLQDALDEKLAEYVFFPLSHVLRESQKLPVRALEICLECNSSHRATFTALESLVERISSSNTSLTIARESLDLVFGSQGDTRLAGFWLSFKLIEAICNQGMAMEDIIDYGDSSSNLRDSLVEELYSFSLSLLAEDELDVETDWRLQALALETVALQARRQKLDFRVDLVDALYLVIQLLGFPVQQLREHAMTCLNVLTTACGYKSTSDLIIANVDYLINAVALRLSSFEISPQAPRVLYMMVKLSGPSLLPYLDDIVDSIFAALENFHGYSKLVELLFTVLTGIVEEGTKTQQLAVADGNPGTHRKPAIKPVTVTEVARLMAENRNKAARDVPDSSTEDQVAYSSLPMRPWKKTHDDSDPSSPKKDITQEADTDPEVQDESDSPDPPPPAEKTYKTLLTITQLTQHYLSSASPSLRISLLSLLNTSIPTLALHENSFLPLINTLWSVLVSRLDEPEAYVVASTLDIVGLLCIHAGDFMKGRIDSIWDDVRKMYISLTKKTAVLERSIPKSVQPFQPPKISGTVSKAIVPAPSSPPDPYVDAPTRLIRETLIRFMCTLVEYVAIDDKTFDDIVAMLAPYLMQRPQIRETLERRNPDAVWLA
ncbi:hypothetical protein B0A49_12930, partial [Cryomyces minteri]